MGMPLLPPPPLHDIKVVSLHSSQMLGIFRLEGKSLRVGFHFNVVASQVSSQQLKISTKKTNKK